MNAGVMARRRTQRYCFCMNVLRLFKQVNFMQMWPLLAMTEFTNSRRRQGQMNTVRRFSTAWLLELQMPQCFELRSHMTRPTCTPSALRNVFQELHLILLNPLSCTSPKLSSLKQNVCFSWLSSKLSGVHFVYMRRNTISLSHSLSLLFNKMCRYIKSTWNFLALRTLLLVFYI